MKRLLAILSLAIVACGAMPAAVANMPTQATQTDSPEFTATTPPTDTKTPVYLVVLGSETTWNIRECPSLECHAIDIYAVGGQSYKLVTVDGAWVKIPDGWVCGQAFGGSEECR